jgi:hypothetical protein
MWYWHAQRDSNPDLLIRSPVPAEPLSLPYLVLNRPVQAARSEMDSG